MWPTLKPLNDPFTHRNDMMCEPINVLITFSLETDDWSLALVFYIIICVIFLIKMLLYNRLFCY